MTRRDPQSGVTLVEVLIVLTLVGILGGLASLSIGAVRSGPNLDRIAQTLATRMTLAAEQAIYTGQDATLSVTQDGYRFRVFDGAEWVAHPIATLGAVERMPGSIALARDNTHLSIPASATLPAPIRLRLQNANRSIEVVFDGLAAQVTTAARL